MSGMFIVKKSFVLATLLAPLLAGTLMWWYYTDKQFRPLSKYVSLSSVHEVERGEESADEGEVPEREGALVGVAEWHVLFRGQHPL